MSGIYFSHDSSARGDEKIIALRMKHSWAGYGLYWALIEKLVEATCYTLAIDYNLLAFDLRTDASLIKSIINEFGLFAFTENGECFYSDSLLKRMQLKDERSKKMSEAGKKGNQKKWENIAMRSGSDREAIAINKEINKSIKEINKESKKSHPHFDEFLNSNKIYNSENSEFLSSEMWFKTKAMQLSSQPEILIEKAKDFLVDLNHRDQIEGKNLADLRSHFVSWFKLKRSQEPENKKVDYRIPKYNVL